MADLRSLSSKLSAVTDSGVQPVCSTEQLKRRVGGAAVAAEFAVRALRAFGHCEELRRIANGLNHVLTPEIRSDPEFAMNLDVCVCAQMLSSCDGKMEFPLPF